MEVTNLKHASHQFEEHHLTLSQIKAAIDLTFKYKIHQWNSCNSEGLFLCNATCNLWMQKKSVLSTCFQEHKLPFGEKKNHPIPSLSANGLM